MIIISIPESTYVSFDYEEALRDGYLQHREDGKVIMTLPDGENPFDWTREYWSSIIERSGRIGAILEEQGYEVLY